MKTTTKSKPKVKAINADMELSAYSKPVVTKKKAEKFDREKSAADELAGLSDHFKSIKALDKRMKMQLDDTLDSEFWIAICFQNREQKEEFLRLLKIPRPLGDKYLDGMKVAKVLGVELKTPVPQLRRHRGVDHVLLPFVMKYDPDKELR